jgi:hypothetical protein
MTGTASVLVVHLPLPRVQSFWQTRMVPDATAGFIRIASCTCSTSLLHTRAAAARPLDCVKQLLLQARSMQPESTKEMLHSAAQRGVLIS